MSLDELRDDLKRNLAEAKACENFEQVKAHLVNTLWPFIEAQLDVVDDMDDAVAELVDHEEDYLQPDTAAVFAAVVQLSLTMGNELKKRAPADKDIAALVAQNEQVCQQAIEILGAITMVPTEDNNDDEDEDDDEDEATPQGGAPDA